MSVPITVIVADPEAFAETFSDDTFFEQLEAGEFEEEEFTSDELDFQLRLLECYNGFKENLPQTTRTAIEDFMNTVFWSFRSEDGKLQRDIELESEGLDSSYSSQTCSHLSSLLGQIDWSAVESAFEPDAVFGTSADFKCYFDQWKRVLDKASATGRAVFVFVFP